MKFAILAALAAASVASAAGVDPSTIDPCVVQCTVKTGGAAPFNCGSTIDQAAVDCICKDKNAFITAASPCVLACGVDKVSAALAVFTQLCSEGLAGGGATSSAPPTSTEAPPTSTEAPPTSTEAPPTTSAAPPSSVAPSSGAPGNETTSSAAPPTGASSGAPSVAPTESAPPKPSCDPRGGSGACQGQQSVPAPPPVTQSKPVTPSAGASSNATGADAKAAGANAGSFASTTKASLGFAGAAVLGAVVLAL